MLLLLLLRYLLLVLLLSHLLLMMLLLIVDGLLELSLLIGVQWLLRHLLKRLQRHYRLLLQRRIGELLHLERMLHLELNPSTFQSKL